MNLTRTPSAFAAIALLATTAFAQTPPPPPGPPTLETPAARPPMPGAASGPGARALRGPRPGEDFGRVGSEASLTGHLSRWLVNPNGEADGFLLKDGTQVVFPPHLSAALLDAVKPGEAMEIVGWRGATDQVVRASVVRVTASGRVVADTPPDPRLGPPPAPRAVGALTSIVANGRVATALYTDRGDVNGALLQDGTIVRFPPHLGPTLSVSLQPGASLYARGYGARSALGTALEATAIGTDERNARDLYAGPGPGVAGGPAISAAR